jgi:ribonuclease P protein component
VLSKRNRIKKAEFDGVFSSGKRFNSRNFTLIATRSPEYSACAFSVSVPKKHFKSAVLRNKVRRRLYAALGKAPFEAVGFKGVFIVRKGIEEVPSTQLTEEVVEALAKATRT